MATLGQIETLLNIELGDKHLCKGKKKHSKNQYYYFFGLFYIISLTKNLWMIAEDSRHTRDLLRNHCFYVHSCGYACTSFNGTTQYWHHMRIHYEQPNVCDHINRCRYDNRLENLRIVTQRENNRNMTKRNDNTSGKAGIGKCTKKGKPYWRARIHDNDGKRLEKRFSINRHGDQQAYQMAVAWRVQKEQLFGYLGE